MQCFVYACGLHGTSKVMNEQAGCCVHRTFRHELLGFSIVRPHYTISLKLG